MTGRLEVLVSGHGGQGVVRMGQVLGLAAVQQGLAATMLVSHGTETRGGYVRSQVVISPGEVDSPVVERADVLCAMTQEAYDRFRGLARGTLVYDPARVVVSDDPAARRLALPAAARARAELGDALFANAVFLGAIGWLLEGALSPDRLCAALLERIPRFPDQNRRALELGRALAGASAGAAG